MDKFFLKSKTIIGILLAAAVGIAPELGLSFGEDSAAMISAEMDKIIQALSLLFSVFGRFKATGSVTLLPGSGSAMRSPWMISMLAAVLLFLGGCSTLKSWIEEDNAILKISVVEAVSYRIRSDKSPADRAVNILTYAQDARARIDADAVTTFDGIQQILVDGLPDYLTPTARAESVALIESIVDKARERAVREVGKANIQNVKFIASYFLDAVIETANYYVL